VPSETCTIRTKTPRSHTPTIVSKATFGQCRGGVGIFAQRPGVTEVAMQNSRTLGRSNLFMKPRFHRIATALTIAATFGAWGCGAGPTSSSSPRALVNVTVMPNSVPVLRDATQAFTAKVAGPTNTAVTWGVEPSAGGTIDSEGFYTPPSNGAGIFYTLATSQANSIASSVAVCLERPISSPPASRMETYWLWAAVFLPARHPPSCITEDQRSFSQVQIS
jgi:hypothetical protein